MNTPHHDFSKAENVRCFLAEYGCIPNGAMAVYRNIDAEKAIYRALFGDKEHKPAKG